MVMQDVRQIADEIVAREGGFVNDPDDPGGATKHGVTIGTMRRLGLDLDGDGDVDVDDVRRVTPRIARDVFLRHYYHGPGIDRLPEPLRASVFDMYVNAGSHAVRILQRLLNEMGEALTVDGKIGPITRAAAERAMAAAPDHLADAYGIARRTYYYGIADARPAAAQVRAAAGWRQGRLDRAGGGVHLGALPPDAGAARPEGGGMGVITGVLDAVFGGGRNVVAETVEVFRENAEGAAVRERAAQADALAQFGAEFAPRGRGRFDRFMDGLNRVPRPALALGTLGLFVSAMVDPAWFASRMEGVALVPEPLWWLLGAIVSFYFGARHQAKGQQFRLSVAETVAQARARVAAAAVETAEEAAGETAEENAALADWRRGAA